VEIVVDCLKIIVLISFLIKLAVEVVEMMEVKLVGVYFSRIIQMINRISKEVKIKTKFSPLILDSNKTKSLGIYLIIQAMSKITNKKETNKT